VNPAAPRRTTGRSVAAVAAGFVATAALSLGLDAALHAAGIFPPWGTRMAEGLFVLATAYRVAFTVLGGWLTARLAPARPMTHAWALGLVGTAVAAAGAAATWNAGPAFGPRWYPLALVVTALPSVLGGARLWTRSEGEAAARSSARA
jgi:hypothetical protein